MHYSKDYSTIGQVAGLVAGILAGLAYAWLTKDTEGVEAFPIIGATIGLFVGWAYGKLRRRRIGS